MPFVAIEEDRPCIVDAEEGEVGLDTEFPFGISLATLFKWKYRVKTWKMTVDFTASSASASATASGSGGSVSASASLSGELSEETSSAGSIVSERSFACFIPSHSTGFDAPRTDSDFNESGVVGDSVSAFAEVSLEMHASLSISFDQIKKFDGLYYPRISILADIFRRAVADGVNREDDEDIFGHAVAENVGETDTLFTMSELAPTGTASITLDGVAFDILLWHSDAGIVDFNLPPGCTASASVSGGVPSVTIAPAEYWTWDPSDGNGPYYNTTTGVKIRN